MEKVQRDGHTTLFQTTLRSSSASSSIDDNRQFKLEKQENSLMFK